MDGPFDRQKTMGFKIYLLLLLCHVAINRVINRSFPISSQLNRCEIPTFPPMQGQKFVAKSPYSPTSAQGPPLPRGSQ